MGLIIAVSLAVSCAGADTDQRPLPPPKNLPEPPRLEPAANLWPEAMITLPARGPGGTEVQPLAMLGEDEALMITSVEWRPIFYSYDLRKKKFRVLATAPEWAECGSCFEVMSVGVSENRIVWTAGVYRSEPWNSGKRHVELWTMPRSGGPMELVAWLTGHGELPFSDELSIIDDHAVWSGGSRAYRVSLDSGAAVPLPVRPKAKLVSVLGLRDSSCGPEWCVAGVAARRFEMTKLVIQRKDGSGRREIAAASGEALMNDRFGLFEPPYVYGAGERSFTNTHPAPQPILYDRCTNRSGRIGGLREDSAIPEVFRGAAVPGGEPVLYWNTQNHKTWHVLDLSRISDRPCAD